MLEGTSFDVLDSGHDYVSVLQSLRGEELAPPERRGEPVEFLALEGKGTIFGRKVGIGVVLPHRLINARHAVVERSAEGWVVRDLRTRTGTFINGKAIVRARLRPGDLLQLGPYVFHFKRGLLWWLRQPTALTLAALNLRQSAGLVTLLDSVTLVAQPGEFIGLLGPSGAGKTTLLNALSGFHVASGGQVLVNGEPLYGHYDRWRRLIGHVPQDELVHPELTCRQAFYFSVRLRLPVDTPEEELAAALDETLEVLELTHRADVQIGRLSGGQRKRVSVGVELLGRPRLLFLDEPTSGLDPGTEARLMRLFRELAHQGRTLVCTTHSMENLDLFDRIAVLAEGGCLVFFGPPDQALAYFVAERAAEVYHRLEEHSPEKWQSRFRRSSRGRELDRQAAAERVPRPFHRQAGPDVGPGRSTLGQWQLLTRRFGRVLLADRRALFMLIAQPLLIGGLVCAVFRDMRSVYFLLVVSAIWFSCSQAAQQLVRERPAYRRERMVGLSLVAYLLSKFFLLAAVGAGQAMLMQGEAWIFKGSGGIRWMQVLAILLASWNGVALGLIISALARNADRATAVVPFALLPQIILGGILVALPDMNLPTRLAADLTIAKWSNQAMEISAVEGRNVDKKIFHDAPDLWRLWNLYPDYNLKEEQGRARFVQEHQGETIHLPRQLAMVHMALCGLLLGQMIIAGIVLRRQDPL